MRNHIKPNRRGAIKASESVIQMFKTEKGRSLAWQFLFLVVAQGISSMIFCWPTGTWKPWTSRSRSTRRKKRRSNWKADMSLPSTLSRGVGLSYLVILVRFILSARDMIEHSKRWAAARGLLATNEVHGQEEWRIPLQRTYSHSATHGRVIAETVNTTVQELG